MPGCHLLGAGDALTHDLGGALCEGRVSAADGVRADAHSVGHDTHGRLGRVVERDTFFWLARLGLAVVELLVLLELALVELLALGAVVLEALVCAGTNAAVLPVPVLPHAASTVAPATVAAANEARRGSRVDGVGRKVTKSPGLS